MVHTVHDRHIRVGLQPAGPGFGAEPDDYDLDADTAPKRHSPAGPARGILDASPTPMANCRIFAVTLTASLEMGSC